VLTAGNTAQGDDVFGEEGSQSAFGLAETALTFADPHVTIWQLPANTNCESTAQDEDAVYLQTMPIGSEGATVAIKAIARPSPIRAQGLIATQSLYQKSSTAKACPAQAQPLHDADPGLPEAIRAV
jgi:hypothetical protein